MSKYLVVFEETSSGYSAYVPDLPGCIATGMNKSSTEETIYEAIRFHLEGLELDKQVIPPGKAESEVFVFQ